MLKPSKDLLSILVYNEKKILFLNLVKITPKDSFIQILFILPNFWTRNSRKQIKGSKDSDFSLVSTKYLREKLPLCGWSLGTDNLGQKGLNLHYLSRHPQKKRNFAD